MLYILKHYAHHLEKFSAHTLSGWVLRHQLY